MVDEPLHFQGGLTKRSYFNKDGRVTINDKQALMHSSNVFMFKTALKLAGDPYYSGMPLPNDIATAGQKLRKGLNQVGLGVKTGVDLPNETPGQIEPLTNNPGNYLDLSIGQYDTYTPLQLSQYVSTIANNGYRIQPHIGLAIHESTNKDELGPLKRKIKGNVLNRVNNSENEIKEVQDGFKMAFNEKMVQDMPALEILSYHQQVKRVQLRYSKMVNQELTLLILVTHLLMIQNFHSQSSIPINPSHHLG